MTASPKCVCQPLQREAWIIQFSRPRRLDTAIESRPILKRENPMQAVTVVTQRDNLGGTVACNGQCETAMSSINIGHPAYFIVNDGTEHVLTTVNAIIISFLCVRNTTYIWNTSITEPIKNA